MVLRTDTTALLMKKLRNHSRSRWILARTCSWGASWRKVRLVWWRQTRNQQAHVRVGPFLDLSDVDGADLACNDFKVVLVELEQRHVCVCVCVRALTGLCVCSGLL